MLKGFLYTVTVVDAILNMAKAARNEVNICTGNPCEPQAEASALNTQIHKVILFLVMMSESRYPKYGHVR